MSRAVIITSYLEHPLTLSRILKEDDFIVCLDGGYDIAMKQGIRPHLLLGDFDSISGQRTPNLHPAGVPVPAPSPNASGDAPAQSLMHSAAPYAKPAASHSKPAASEGNNPSVLDADEILRFPPEKDYTDLELALRLLDPVKTPELMIVGGLGGRLDQTMVNIQLLDRYTAASGPTNPAPASDAADSRYGSFHVYSRIDILDGHHRAFIAYGPSAEKTGNVSCCCENPEEPGRYKISEEPGRYKISEKPGCYKISEKPGCYKIPEEPGCYLSLLPLTPACSGVSLKGVKYPLSDATLYRGASLGISNEFEEEEAILQIRSGRLLVIVTRANAQDTLPGRRI